MSDKDMLKLHDLIDRYGVNTLCFEMGEYLQDGVNEMGAYASEGLANSTVLKMLASTLYQ
jgi:hypothetical protein